MDPGDCAFKVVVPSLVGGTQRRLIFLFFIYHFQEIWELWMRRDHHNVVWINEPVVMQEKSSCVTMLTTAIHHAKFLIKTMPLTRGVLHRECQTEFFLRLCIWVPGLQMQDHTFCKLRLIFLVWTPHITRDFRLGDFSHTNIFTRGQTYIPPFTWHAPFAEYRAA